MAKEAGSQEETDALSRRHMSPVTLLGIPKATYCGHLEEVKMQTTTRFCIWVIAVMTVAAGAAMACPKNTHPVCHYDSQKHKSVCHCVAK